MESKYISGAAGLARYLNVGRFLAEKIISDGLPSYRVDRKFLFRVDQVDEFMERYMVGRNDQAVAELTEKLLGGKRSSKTSSKK